MTPTRDHGGGLDAAILSYGGTRADWIDLSKGIDPVAHPVSKIPAHAWNASPDRAATERLTTTARNFWNEAEEAGIIAAPGASALIARMPDLAPAGTVSVLGSTYNEHAAAWQDRRAQAHGWTRVFPYSDRWRRLDLPAPNQWAQLEAAL